MTISLLDYVQKNESISDSEFLRNINNIFQVEKGDEFKGIFYPLIGTHSESVVRSIIVYTAWAYTESSPMLVSGASSISLRRKISHFVNLPEFLHQDIVYLKSPVYRSIIVDYLEFQHNREFSHYQKKIMLYEAINDGSVKKMYDDDGEFDFKAIKETNAMSNEVLEDIRKYEEEYKQRFSFVPENKNEIEEIAKTDGKIFSLAPESSREVSKGLHK